MKNQCKMNDFQQIVSAADVRRDSQISVAVSVILWTASEASTAEISLKLLEIPQKLLAVSVIPWTASATSTAEISLKLLEIPQKLFNVFFNCNALPVPCQERFSYLA